MKILKQTLPIQPAQAFNATILKSNSNQKIPVLQDKLSLGFCGSPTDLQNPELSLEAFKEILSQKTQTLSSSNRVETIAELTETLDLYLQGKWTDEAQPGKKAEILTTLKQLMGIQGQGNLVLAQIDTTPGRVLENGKKIMAYIKAAEAIGVDMVVFPEMSLMGYPIYDGIGRYRTLVEQNVQVLKELAKRTGKTRVAIGFVEPRLKTEVGRVVGRALYNSVAILGEGKIEGLIRKSLLPNYGEFDDYRSFEPSPASGVQNIETFSDGDWGFTKLAEANGKHSEIHGHRWGVVICEDGWNDDQFFNDGKLYTKDPLEDLVKGGAEILINTSASPTRTLKEQLKHNMLASVSQRHERPMVYVNRTGAVDEVIFDGTSRVYDVKGNLIARAKPFQEQFMIVNPVKSEGKIYPLPEGEETTFCPPKKAFNPFDTSDLARTHQALVQGIKSFFQSSGMKRAVLGLSGGLDSSVVAVLLAEALGPKNVLGISMPSKITAKDSRTDAHLLADNLGINFIEIPIKHVVDRFEKDYEKALTSFWQRTKNFFLKLIGQKPTQEKNAITKFWGDAVNDDIPHQNIQAITRATFLRYISNKFPGTLPIATSDKSELYIGYATVNGDMSGAIAPIGDVMKMKLFGLARYMNDERAKTGQKGIPEAVLLKKPGAELSINPKTGKPVVAEDDYGPYEFRDEIIWRMENLNQTYSEMMQEPFWYEEEMAKKGTPLSKAVKKEWMDKFLRRMGNSFFKWYIIPTTLNIDTKSITKSTFRIPLATARSNWQGLKTDEIEKALN